VKREANEMKLKAFLQAPGVQARLSVSDSLDSGLRRNDKQRTSSTSRGIVVFGLIFCWSLLISPFVLAQQTDNSRSSAPVFGYKIINVFPHDPEAFTQGLVFHKGALYEGTGLLGKSTLRKVDPETGRILKLVQLPDQLFGEGITLWEDKVIQLTWRSGVGLVYDRESFRLLKKFKYFSEGWGLTQDGKQLIMSDGTSFLYFWDPHSFKEVKRIQVLDRGIPITLLNELEYIKGEIFANVYLTDRIVRISPETGRVTGWIDLQGLLPAKNRTGKEDVLNGIAYDARKDRILVTGKYWPKLFEIRLVPQ
jgi:glutamine cyclotransferase